jgi:hypothetical protein
MSYFLRAFCREACDHSSSAVLLYVQNEGLRVEPATAAQVSTGESWRSLEVRCTDGTIFTLVRDTLADDGLREELEEFIELVEDLPDSAGQRAVLEDLRRTEMVVAAELPGSATDDAIRSAAKCIQYFVEFCRGRFQADGEGFYENGHLILDVE